MNKINETQKQITFFLCTDIISLKNILYKTNKKQILNKNILAISGIFFQGISSWET